MARPKKYTQQFISKEALALVAYAKRTPVPLEKEFASRRGYSSQRLPEFAKESAEFSEALKKMKDLQEVKIVKAALTGQVIASVAIFMLKNVAGWRDVPIEDKKDNGSFNLADLVKQVSEAHGGRNLDTAAERKVDPGIPAASGPMSHSGPPPIRILRGPGEDGIR